MNNSNWLVGQVSGLFNLQSRFRVCALAATGLVLTHPVANAATAYWNGTGSDWTTTATGTSVWSTTPTAATPNAPVPGVNDDVVFSIDSVNTAQTINLTTANRTVRSLTFSGSNSSTTTLLASGANRNITVGAGGITMQAGAGQVTIGGGAFIASILVNADQTWTLNSSNSLTLVGAFNQNAAASVTFSGTGTGSLNLNGAVTIGNTNGVSSAARQTSGTIVAGSSFFIGGAAGSYGYYSMEGGHLNLSSATQFRVGTAGSAATTGVMNMTGGLLTLGSTVTNGLVIAGTQNTDTNAAGQGTFIITGGTASIATHINVGRGSNLGGQLTIDNAALVQASGTTFLAGGASGTPGSTGVLNLNGGVLQTSAVIGQSVPGSRASYVNFDGGTLRATQDTTAFLQGNTRATINDEGAIIDTNGHNVTIAQNLEAPTGQGVSTITVTGTGYRGAPNVLISGDGTGATAVANIDASGNLTGITVTNAGVGYTTATITLSGGGGATNSSTVVNLATNTSGGLTKTGSGVLTLTGNNTYTGNTDVTEGTLIVGVSGTGSLASAVIVDEGATLGGSGTISGPVVVNGTLAPGNSPGTLTINNSLTLGTDALTTMELAGAASYDSIVVTGALTLDGVIRVSLTGGYIPDSGTSFTLFSGWSGSIVDNGFTFDFSAAVLPGSMEWDTTNFLTTGAITAVPEPSTWALLGVGLALSCWRLRIRRNAA